MSKLLVPLLVAFILVILWRWPPITVFENFLEKKEVFQQKNCTTFIDSHKASFLTKYEERHFFHHVPHLTQSPEKVALKTEIPFKLSNRN